MDMVVVRYHGKMYHIAKGALETDEKSMDRAWYVAKKEPSKKEFVETMDESHKWCNEKYLGMKYDAMSGDETVH